MPSAAVSIISVSETPDPRGTSLALETTSDSSPSPSRALTPPSKSRSLTITSFANLADPRARHVRDRSAADAVRLAYLETGLAASPPHVQRSRLHALHAVPVTESLRYTVEVEASDGGKNVRKRISVIFPLQLRTVTAAHGLAAHTRTVRNIARLPCIRNLALLPPSPKVRRFRSLTTTTTLVSKSFPIRKGASGGHVAPEDLAVRPTVAVQSEGASGLVDRTAVWAYDQQQRLLKRSCSDLAQDGSEVASSIAGDSVLQNGGDAGAACGNKRARLLLCERRGKCVELLNIG